MKRIKMYKYVMGLIFAPNGLTPTLISFLCTSPFSLDLVNYFIILIPLSLVLATHSVVHCTKLELGPISVSIESIAASLEGKGALI